MKRRISLLLAFLAAFWFSATWLLGGPLINPYSISSPPKFTIADISGTQGANGWSAGYSNSNTPATFSTSGMTWASPNWGGTQSFGTPFVGAAFMHPGIDSENSAAAAFVAPTSMSGTITLKASAVSGAVTMRVWQNTGLLGSLSLTGSITTLSIPGVTIAPGDVILLECDPNGDSSSDSTTITEFTLR